MPDHFLCSAGLSSLSQQVVVWSLVLLLVISVGLVLVTQLKKRVLDQDTGSKSDVGFSLSDLRAMLKDGRLTNEEFEKARDKIVAAAKRADERDSKR